MASLGAKSAIKRVQIEATVIRADGTTEKLGTVSDSSWRGFSLRRLLSRWRIARANQRIGG